MPSEFSQPQIPTGRAIRILEISNYDKIEIHLLTLEKLNSIYVTKTRRSSSKLLLLAAYGKVAGSNRRSLGGRKN